MQNELNLGNLPTSFFKKKRRNKFKHFVWLQILAIIPINLMANWLMGTCLICDLFHRFWSLNL